MLRRYEAQLRQQGVDEETIPKLVEQAHSQAQSRVQRDLRLSFLLDKIAAERKVFVTENETRQEVAGIAARYGKGLPEMEEYMERNGLLPALRSELRDRKTLRDVRGVVKVVDDVPAAAAASEPAGEVKS
jgi:FKBP-type peptidyl-prolyl cis-trans isomerase (trigger factor)